MGSGGGDGRGGGSGGCKLVLGFLPIVGGHGIVSGVGGFGRIGAGFVEGRGARGGAAKRMAFFLVLVGFVLGFFRSLVDDGRRRWFRFERRGNVERRLGFGKNPQNLDGVGGLLLGVEIEVLDRKGGEGEMVHFRSKIHQRLEIGERGGGIHQHGRRQGNRLQGLGSIGGGFGDDGDGGLVVRSIGFGLAGGSLGFVAKGRRGGSHLLSGAGGHDVAPGRDALPLGVGGGGGGLEDFFASLGAVQGSVGWRRSFFVSGGRGEFGGFGHGGFAMASLVWVWGE